MANLPLHYGTIIKTTPFSDIRLPHHSEKHTKISAEEIDKRFTKVEDLLLELQTLSLRIQSQQQELTQSHFEQRQAIQDITENSRNGEQNHQQLCSVLEVLEEDIQCLKENMNSMQNSLEQMESQWDQWEDFIKNQERSLQTQLLNDAPLHHEDEMSRDFLVGNQSVTETLQDHTAQQLSWAHEIKTHDDGPGLDFEPFVPNSDTSNHSAPTEEFDKSIASIILDETNNEVRTEPENLPTEAEKININDGAQSAKTPLNLIDLDYPNALLSEEGSSILTEAPFQEWGSLTPIMDTETSEGDASQSENAGTNESNFSQIIDFPVPENFESLSEKTPSAHFFQLIEDFYNSNWQSDFTNEADPEELLEEQLWLQENTEPIGINENPPVDTPVPNDTASPVLQIQNASFSTLISQSSQATEERNYDHTAAQIISQASSQEVPNSDKLHTTSTTLSSKQDLTDQALAILGHQSIVSLPKSFNEQLSSEISQLLTELSSRDEHQIVTKQKYELQQNQTNSEVQTPKLQSHLKLSDNPFALSGDASDIIEIPDNPTEALKTPIEQSPAQTDPPELQIEPLNIAEPVNSSQLILMDQDIFSLLDDSDDLELDFAKSLVTVPQAGSLLQTDNGPLFDDVPKVDQIDTDEGIPVLNLNLSNNYTNQVDWSDFLLEDNEEFHILLDEKI